MTPQGGRLRLIPCRAVIATVAQETVKAQKPGVNLGLSEAGDACHGCGPHLDGRHLREVREIGPMTVPRIPVTFFGIPLGIAGLRRRGQASPGRRAQAPGQRYGM